MAILLRGALLWPLLAIHMALVMLASDAWGLVPSHRGTPGSRTRQHGMAPFVAQHIPLLWTMKRFRIRSLFEPAHIPDTSYASCHGHELAVMTPEATGRKLHMLLAARLAAALPCGWQSAEEGLWLSS